MLPFLNFHWPQISIYETKYTFVYTCWPKYIPLSCQKCGILVTLVVDIYHRSTEIDFRMLFSWKPSINLALVILVYNISIINSCPTSTAWELCYKLIKICEYLMMNAKIHDPLSQYDCHRSWSLVVQIPTCCLTGTCPMPELVLTYHLFNPWNVNNGNHNEKLKILALEIGIVKFWNQNQVSWVIIVCIIYVFFISLAQLCTWSICFFFCLHKCLIFCQYKLLRDLKVYLYTAADPCYSFLSAIDC